MLLLLIFAYEPKKIQIYRTWMANCDCDRAYTFSFWWMDGRSALDRLIALALVVLDKLHWIAYGVGVTASTNNNQNGYKSTHRHIDGVLNLLRAWNNLKSQFNVVYEQTLIRMNRERCVFLCNLNRINHQITISCTHIMSSYRLTWALSIGHIYDVNIYPY